MLHMGPRTRVVSFDSSTAMLRALAAHLHGRSLPALGALPGRAEPAAAALGRLINALPAAAREAVYTWSGSREATPPERLAEVRSEEVARWTAGLYPRRDYPAAAIGSSNGALVHLCAALGIPWLPQTFLVTARRSGISPDEPAEDLEWGRRISPPLLRANPDLALHQMLDPNQDRLMARRMTYLRLKRLRLGETFERFLGATLRRNATIFLVECALRWPTTRLGERHVFQFGGLGGATVREFFGGGPRVEEYLGRYGSRRRWHPPPPDGESPEAEWGFEPALAGDVERFCRERGYRLRRITFEQPEDLSALVADLYRFWYARRGMPEAESLQVGSFILLQPHLAIRRREVPFWMAFNTEPSAEALERYLDAAGPFDNIGLTLFSHGVESVGVVPIGRWRSILGRARRRGAFVGVDAARYPRDFAVFARHHLSLRRSAPPHPLPQPLTPQELEQFLERAGESYPVRWS